MEASWYFMDVPLLIEANGLPVSSLPQIPILLFIDHELMRVVIGGGRLIFPIGLLPFVVDSAPGSVYNAA